MPEIPSCVRQHGIVDSVVVHGTRISYWRVGESPNAIVFIHGNSARKEVFYRQFGGLADDSTSLLSIDLPGHGESGDASDPAGQYTIPGYARLIRQVLHDLNVEQTVIVGWSLGGHIALELVASGFDTAGLLIIGTPPAGPGMDEMGDAFLPSEAAAVTMLENPTPEQISAYTNAVYGTWRPVPDWARAAATRTDGRARRIMGEHWISGTEGFSQSDFVANWDGPLCVAHGAQDEFISEKYLQNLTIKNLWRNDIQGFVDCGHAAFLEQPDAFNELLRAFVQDTLGK